MVNETRVSEITQSVELAQPQQSLVLREDNSAVFVAVKEIDWDQYENCQQCRGRAEIDEAPEGDLSCQMCRAQLPKAVT